MKRTEGEVGHGRKVTGFEYIDTLAHRENVIAEIESRPVNEAESRANFDHIAVTWNASKGMTTKQAGLYLEHGETMYEELKALCRKCQGTCVDCVTNKIIAIMESE